MTDGKIYAIILLVIILLLIFAGSAVYFTKPSRLKDIIAKQ